MERLGRRLQVTALLSAGGAAAGALSAVALSFLATAVANASTPTGHVEYYYGPAGFAFVGAVGTPVLTWLLMRRVPLWRAILEPAVGGVLGTLLALITIPLFHPPLLVQPLCMLGGIGIAALRLRRANGGHRVELPGGEFNDVPARSPHTPANVSLLLTGDLRLRLRRNGDTSPATELGR
jgi:hypothetical protein